MAGLMGCGVRRSGAAGFTLVEILIVIVILGIIAALVLANFGSATESARQGAFVSDVRTYAQAAEYYMVRTSRLLPDSSTGNFPAEWTGYVDPERWEGPTPIGGEWDIEQGGFAASGMLSGFGVHFNGVTPRSDEYMEQIDAQFDDGSLTSGVFRKVANDRFYYVLVSN